MKNYIRIYGKGGVCIFEAPNDSVVCFQRGSDQISIEFEQYDEGQIRMQARYALNACPVINNLTNRADVLLSIGK